MIFFGLFWSGMTLMFNGFMVVPGVRQVLAQRFSTTPGTILSSEVTYHDDGDGTTHGVRITYAYTVAGRNYVGDRFRYGNFSSSDCGWASQAVGEHPPGKPVTVFYNPRSPGQALLRPGLAGSDLFMLMFMTPFNAVMLGFWWTGWNRLRRKWRPPLAGGVKLRTELRRTRARMTEFSPLAAGIATTALLAFLGIFVICFGFDGFHPSLRIMTVAWAIVIAVGVMAGLWQWQNVLSGKYDLILDGLNDSVQLPLTCGRKTAKTFPRTEIFSAYTETIEKRDSEGSTFTYVPTLRLLAADGPTEKLAEWHDADRAREFVGWLNEKLGVPAPRYLAGPAAPQPAPGPAGR